MWTIFYEDLNITEQMTFEDDNIELGNVVCVWFDHLPGHHNFDYVFTVAEIDFHNHHLTLIKREDYDSKQIIWNKRLDKDGNELY